MSKIIQNIITSLDGGQLGTIVADWDLEIYFDEQKGVHPDNTTRSEVEYRRLDNLNYLELQAFDKIGINMTDAFKADKGLMITLEEKLLAEIEDTSTEDLENNESEPDFDGESDYGNSWENGGREQAAYYQTLK